MGSSPSGRGGYFDHNATSPLCEAAREAWLDAVDRFPGNPSSPHRVGDRSATALREARERLAGILGCSPPDLIWTGGATEAGNTVFHHYAQRLPAGASVCLSAIEHPCVMEAARRRFRGRVTHIPVGGDGVVARDRLASLEERPALVALMAANNETGVLQPWEEVRDWCREHGIPFFCDAAQWVGKLPAGGLGECDWVGGCAHKFGGPLGVGFLKCPADDHLVPLLAGGPQERSRRAGTENVAGILAMVAALEDRTSRLDPEWIAGREGMRDGVADRLAASLPGLRVLGKGAPRLWNTLSLMMPDNRGCFRWVVKLDRHGFAVSTGSACSSGREKSSHVLAAMGIPLADSGRVLRCSSGPGTTGGDWEALLDAVLRIAAGKPGPSGQGAEGSSRSGSQVERAGR